MYKQITMNKRLEKKKETIERHSKMACKTIQCKIIDNKLSIEKRNYLYRLFLETKWFYPNSAKKTSTFR